MRYFKFFACLIITSFFVTGCLNSDSKTKVDQLAQETINSSQPEPTVNNNLQEEKSTPEINTSSKENTLNHNDATRDSRLDNNDMIQKTKDFILNGQNDKPEADQLTWSETFLNQVDIEVVYKDYLTTGAAADDVESFAKYLTLNAPILDNWEELFAADLLNSYDQKISRMELLQDNLYQVYVIIDGSEVPYVVVNARTGYFHG